MMRQILILSVAFWGFISAANADVTGRWSCHIDFNSIDYPQDLGLVQSGSTITGVEYYAGTDTTFAAISGSISGSTFSITSDYDSSSYVATLTGTVSGDSMSGTWTSNSAQSGTFTCAKSSSSGPGATPTPTPSGKRNSVVRIICNRSGDLLTATCGATVGDTDAPPRITPTGQVSFVNKAGAPSFSAACTLSQTPYSPGVASCTVPYTPPPNFPIAAAFPLDAVYAGDSNFDPSATSHELISASCVGDSLNPCSGAVALEFADLPAIIKNRIKTIGSCGTKVSASSEAVVKTDEFLMRALEDLPKDSCEMTVEGEILFEDLLSELDADDWKELASEITRKDAASDPLLQKIKQIGELPNLQLIDTLSNKLKLAEAMRKANEQYYKQQNNKPKSLSLRTGQIELRSKKSDIPIRIGTVTALVRAGKQKVITLNLNTRAKRFVSVLKAAGVPSANLELSSKFKRKGSRKVVRLKAADEQVELF